MAEVHVRQQFTAGESVELYRRVGDWWNGSPGKPVACETADESGSVTFKGLEDAAPFWAVQGAKALRVSAKNFTEAAVASRDVPSAEIASQSQPAPAREARDGARDTASLRQPAATRKRNSTKKSSSGRRSAGKRK